MESKTGLPKSVSATNATSVLTAKGACTTVLNICFHNIWAAHTFESFIYALNNYIQPTAAVFHSHQMLGRSFAGEEHARISLLPAPQSTNRHFPRFICLYILFPPIASRLTCCSFTHFLSSFFLHMIFLHMIS